jgi:hypothetical protein
MRSNPDNHVEAKKLAARIRKLVFTRPIRADELMLDAARGAVEWAVVRKMLPKTALSDIKRPYGLEPPSTPPAAATLEKKYGFKEKQPDEESYSTILYSLMSMGDFGRYVVESGVNDFSRYRYGQPFPEKEEWPAPRFIKSRWRAFVKSLSPEQTEELMGLLADADGDGDGDRISLIASGVWASLSEDQAAQLQDVWKQPPRRRWRDDEYPADRARRWVFRRTLALGWTPKLFGREDRMLGHSRGGREGHKAERWGKKYQWMAYHELLARIADNFQPARRFDDSGPYEGLHQIIAEREIDPSHPPVDYQAFAERGGEDGATWRPPPIRISGWPPAPINFDPYGGSVDKFLADTASEPTLDKIAFVTDTDSERWCLLDASLSQDDPSAHKSWRGLQQPLALDSWFAPRGDAPDLLPHLADLRRSDRWDLVDDHGHVDCCYAGEIGWSPHPCYNRHADFKNVECAGRQWKLVSTVETVSWEGSLFDCSIEETVAAAMPSTFIQARSTLVLDERGPSSLDGGAVVFTNYGDRTKKCKGLLVRATWLSGFLRQHDLELLLATWYERRFLDDDPRRRYPSEEVYAAARIDADLNIHLAAVMRQRR